MDLGSITREYRLRHRMTMTDFAKKAGLSKGYISMLEKGNNPATGKPMAPSIETIKNIADAMFLDFNDLVNMLDDDIEIKVLNKNLLMLPVYKRIITDRNDAELDIVDYIPVTDEFLDDSLYFVLELNPDNFNWIINGKHYAIIKKQEKIEEDKITVMLINNEQYVYGKIKPIEEGILLNPVGRDGETQFFPKADLISKKVEVIGKIIEIRGKGVGV